jgi:hypothetical protein
LVPQALSGQLTQTTPDDVQDYGRRGRRARRREASLDHAFKNAFMGVAFLLVAMGLAFSRMGTGWWFWMLIPAFSMMGTGVAQFIRVKEREKQMFQAGNFGQPSLPQSQPSLHQPANLDYFPARNTDELVAPPPSVTEGTTRHLGAESPTRHFGEAGEAPK